MALQFTASRSGLSAAAGCLFLAVATGALAAPPSLFYSLLALDHDRDTCMKRAFASLASEISGTIERRTDNVSLVNDDFNIGVHCRTTGADKSFATIVVAHRASFKEARGVALNIRRGMETGIIE